MSKNLFSQDLISGSEFIFDEQRFALKKGERLVLSLLAMAGFLGLLYLGQCKVLLGKHHSVGCQAWKKEITQNSNPIVEQSESMALIN